MIRFLSFWVLAGVLEIPFLLAFTFDPSLLMNRRIPVLAGHGVALLLLFFSEPRGKGWFSSERLWARNLAVAAAFFPFVGWLAMGILRIGEKFRRYETTTTVEEEMDFAPRARERETAAPRKGPRQEWILQELDILPYAEILAGNDYELKRGAIEQMAALKTPEVIVLLEQYRSDPSADIRFLITTALARMKKDFEEELHAAKENLRKDTHDIDCRISLSRTYLQYARSGLVDTATGETYASEALYHLQFAVLADEAPIEVFTLLIGIYREQGDWEKVLHLADMMEKRKRGGGKEIAEIRLEVFHEMGRFNDVFAALRKGRGEGQLSARVQPVADWWGA